MLGKELQKIKHDMVCPSHDELEIAKESDIYHYCNLKKIKPDIIINAAAIKDNRTIELNPVEAVETNIIGAARVALECYKQNIRYVYISTDYIYPGDRGNYHETDPILPANIYAWTKLGGECSAKTVKN